MSQVIVPDGIPQRRGICLSLWRGDSMANVLTPWCRVALQRISPQAVCLHAGPERLQPHIEDLRDALRHVVPNAEVVIGIGCDYWLKAACHRTISVGFAAAKIALGFSLARNVQAKRVLLDSEGAAKIDSNISHQVLSRVVAIAKANFPELLVGVTSYDQPTQHADDKDGDYDDDSVRGEYPWRALLAEGQLPWTVKQTYVVPESGGDAWPGTLSSRIERSDKSFEIAKRLGWIAQNVHQDLYFQVYRTDVHQLVSNGLRNDWIFGWCGPELPRGRMDERGVIALEMLSTMEHLGIRHPGGIELLQGGLGVEPDGDIGPKTIEAFTKNKPALPK